MADLGAKLAAVKAAARPPHSQGDTPCFLYVWQGKDLREGEFVCVAAKGVTADFADVWQGKGLGSGGSENINFGTLGVEAEVSTRKWRGIRGNGRRATIMPEFTV